MDNNKNDGIVTIDLDSLMSINNTSLTNDSDKIIIEEVSYDPSQYDYNNSTIEEEPIIPEEYPGDQRNPYIIDINFDNVPSSNDDIEDGNYIDLSINNVENDEVEISSTSADDGLIINTEMEEINNMEQHPNINNNQQPTENKKKIININDVLKEQKTDENPYVDYIVDEADKYVKPGGILDKFIDKEVERVKQMQLEELNKTTDKEVDSIGNTLDEVFGQSENVKLSEEIKSDMNVINNNENTSNKKVENKSETVVVDEDDFDFDEDDDVSENDNEGDTLDTDDDKSVEDALEEEINISNKIANDTFKQRLSEKLKLSSKKMNKNVVKIQSKLMYTDDILSVLKREDGKDWVLFNAAESISTKSIGGSDLLKLRNLFINMNNNPKAANDYFALLYKYTNTNLSLDDWMKTISIYDLDNLHMAFFNSTFGDTGFASRVCDKCKGPVLFTFNDIMELVKFKTPEDEDKFKKIITNNVNANDRSTLESHIVYLNDKLAVGISAPTLYKLYKEFTLLGNKFISKYSDDIGYLMYIDDVYIITPNGDLALIEHKRDAGWTDAMYIKHKYLDIIKLIKTSSADDFTSFVSIIDELDGANDHVEYILPEVECPGCQEILKEEKTQGNLLLFTRSQLTAYQKK